MKKKFWGLQSYWKWYGLAMTLLVTIINADYSAHRVRTQHNHRRKSIKDFSQSLAANISMDDSTIGSQLERITPIPNTTEFHYEKTTERLCKYHLSLNASYLQINVIRDKHYKGVVSEILNSLKCTLSRQFYSNLYRSKIHLHKLL